MWPRTAMTIRTIGVRQLKNEATQVVRAVREERVVYVITVNGSPAATLRPFSERDIAGVERGEAEAEIAAIERLAAAVGAAWLTMPTLPGSGGER